MNRSQIFTIYNKARGNKALQTLDKARVNKALGLLLGQDQSWRAKYSPTVKSCKCGDRTYRWHNIAACGHMIACMIEVKWERDNPKELTLPAQPKPQIDNNVYMPTSDGDVMVAIQKRGSYDLHIFADASEFETHMKLYGFDGMVVRPSKVRGNKGHTITHYEGS